MSHWSAPEKQTFFNSGMGQIHPKTLEGAFIIDLLEKEAGNTINSVVEIGTWNGLGSTLCILLGLKAHTAVPFYSLECCREKQETAVENLVDFVTPATKLLWGTVVDTDVVSSVDYIRRFDSIVKEWYDVDLLNCKESPNILSELPDQIDFLLLDGGEYTTLNEFEVLQSRCRGYILLDDTTQSKCRLVENILERSPNWRKVFHSDERGGFTCFKRSN